MLAGPSFTRMRNKTFFALLCVTFAGFLAFWGYMYIQSRQFSGTDHTGMVRGRIERLDKIEVPDPVSVAGKPMTYFELAYRYEVDGKSYTGSRVDPRDDGPVPFSRIGRIERPEVGQAVRVYYDPAKPSDAVLFQVNRLDKQYGSIIPSVVSAVLAVVMGLVALRISNRWGTRGWIENG